MNSPWEATEGFPTLVSLPTRRATSTARLPRAVVVVRVEAVQFSS